MVAGRIFHGRNSGGNAIGMGFAGCCIACLLILVMSLDGWFHSSGHEASRSASAILENVASGRSAIHDREIVIRHLPINSIVIVGSLDVSSGLHQVIIESGQSEPAAADSPRVSRCDFPQPVVLQSHGPVSSNTWANRCRQVSASCDGNGMEATDCEASRPLAMERNFLVPRFTDQGTQHVLQGALCVQQYNRVAVYCCLDVWAEQNADQQQLLRMKATLMCDELSTFGLPKVEALLGPVCDADQNDHVTILITDLDQRQYFHDTPVQGCVRENDLLDDQQPFGGDIIYVDHNVPEGAELRALLVHETAHLAVYSAGRRRRITDDRMSPDEFRRRMPSWLNEAIAHTAERLLTPDTDNFARRLQLFRNSTGLCPIIPPAGNSTLASRRGGARAAATLFVESVVNQPDDLKQLLVLDLPPLQCLGELGRKPFDQAFRDWTIYSLIQLTNTPEEHQHPDRDAPADSLSMLPIGRRTRQSITIQGTAAAYCTTVEPVDSLRILSSTESELQVTVLQAERLLK